MDKQRQKQEKKAEQKAAKEERRQSKKAESASSKLELEAQEAREQKSKEAEELKSKEALQAVSVRAAAADVQVHTPPSVGGTIVDELTDYLASASLSDVSRSLDQHFEDTLDSKRSNPGAASQSQVAASAVPPSSRPPPGFASSSSVPSSSLLTAEDESRAARIDFDRLDRATAGTKHQQPPPSTQQQQQQGSEEKTKRLHDEEDEEDYQEYQHQHAAHLIPDDGEYDQIADTAGDEGKDDAEAGDSWEQLADEDDGKASGAAAEADIGALNLQDMTEDEIVLAMVREYEAQQAVEHGLTHDVSTADMTSKLRTHLLDQEEEGPAGFDRQSARDKRREARATETEEERRARKDAKYKQRAQDAAEGILDWDWSSDSDTSGSDDENGEEDEEDDEDEDEEEGEDEDEESESDEDDDEEDEEEDDGEEVKSDDQLDDEQSAEAKDQTTRSAVCTCFHSGSPHDPAMIAAQLDSFVTSDVSDPCSRNYHAYPQHPQHTVRSLIVPLLCCVYVCA